MKTRILLTMLLLFLANLAYYAQSDYERTQNFKNQCRQIENAIRNAASASECDRLGEKIETLRNDFLDAKPILDKALYPDDFTSSIDKLENNLSVRKKDFSQITDLTRQVETMQAQLAELNRKNGELLIQIDELNKIAAKNGEEISKLNKLVSQLRNSVKQRDLLVRDLVDSLLVEFIKAPQDLNRAEKQSLISKVKKSNLFFNVERAIADNIEFVKVTSMTPQDFSDMQRQYHDFSKVWKQIGPKLSAVYLNKKDTKSEITEIDSLFGSWDRQMNDTIWGRITKLFADKGIILLPFSDGDQFRKSVIEYIDEEMKKIPVVGNEEANSKYSTFSDGVYFKTIQPDWMPVLISNNMISDENRKLIEDKIAEWQKELVPSSYAVYIAAAVIILGALLFYTLRRKQNNAVKP